MEVCFYTVPGGHDPLLVWEAGTDAAVSSQSRDGEIVRLVRYERRPPRMFLRRMARPSVQRGSRSAVPADALDVAMLLITTDGTCVLRRDTSRAGEARPSAEGRPSPADFDGVPRISQLDCRDVAATALGVDREEVRYLHLMGLSFVSEPGGSPTLMYRGHLDLSSAELQSRVSTDTDLVFSEPVRLDQVPVLSAMVDDLMYLLIREDMGR